MKKLKYVINSVENYEKAKEILELSLLENNIDEKDIIYVYANSRNLEIKQNHKKQWSISVPYNLFEYSSILGISQLIFKEKDFLNYNYLLLHDTCKALKGFKKKSLIMNEELNVQNAEIFWAHPQGRHNIGIFSSRSIVYLTKKSILPLLEKDFNKDYAIRMEWDEKPESLHLQDISQIYTKDICLLPHYVLSNIYSEKHPRHMAFMTSLYLIKYYVHLGPLFNENVAKRHPNSIV